MPAFVTDAYISNRHLDKGDPCNKTKPQNNSAGTGPVPRLKAANLYNDIMNLGYALLKYYHFLYYLSSLKNIFIKKSI